MGKFIAGLFFGVIIGAVAVFVFSTLGSAANPLANTSGAGGGGVVHVTVDQSYINEKLAAVLADQPQFNDAKAQVKFQAPNSVQVTADVQVTALGNTIKARPTATLQFSVVGGRIHTQLTSVNLGVLNLPVALFQGPVDQLNTIMEDQVNTAVTDALAGTGLKVVNVGSTSTSLVVDLGE
jgi:uncharacterized protein YpmS